jgi:SEC-C motif/Putative zinc- or iron-chelating domain
MSATTDRPKLLRIAQELAEASGRPASRDGKRRLPVIATQDAAGLVAMMHQQLDDAIELRERAISDGGMVLACHRGCTACCTGPVVVNESEAVAVAVWLGDHPEARAQFLEAYPGWRAALGALVEDIFADDSDAGRERAAMAFRERRAMCPFNRQGSCTIYPVRPALCRKAHALENSERCSVIGGEIEYLSHPAVEQTYDAQRGMSDALGEALRPGGREDLLAKSVLRRLTATTAFPNQPCPCGSGQKQKRCCGAAVQG